MLRIVSNPAEATKIIDLELLTEDGFGQSIARPGASPTRDSVFTQPDGSKAVAAYPPRYDIAFGVLDVEYDQYRALMDMLEEGTSVLVLPNLGRDTRLYAPLSKSLAYYAWDTSLQRVVRKVAGDAIYSRPDQAWYREDGEIKVAPSSEPRFESNEAIEGAMRLEACVVNDSSIGHPVNINTYFDAFTNCSAAWVTTELSPVRYELGCGRLESSAAGNYKALSTGETFNGGSGSWYCTSLDMMGSGRVALQAEIGGNIYTSPYFALDHVWRRYTFVFQKTTADTTGDFGLVGTAQDATDAVFYGAVQIKRQTTNTDAMGPMEWSPVPTPGSTDVLAYQLDCPSADFTWSIQGLVPRSNALVPLYQFNGSPNEVSASIDKGSLIFTVGAYKMTMPLTNLGAPGSLFWAAGRVKLRHSFFGDPEAGVTAYYQSQGNALETMNEVAPAVADYNGTGVQVGAIPLGIDPPGDTLLAQVRVDARAWSDEEVVWHARQWLDPAWRQMSIAAQGRAYRISNVDLSTMGPDGNWDRFGGVIGFEELEAYSDLAVTHG